MSGENFEEWRHHTVTVTAAIITVSTFHLEDLIYLELTKRLAQCLVLSLEKQMPEVANDRR